MYNVVLVEDEKIIRSGLKSLIEDVIGGFRVIGEAENGKEALELLQRIKPDILITDIRMNEMNGLEMIKRIRIMHNNLPIVIVSGYAEFEYAKQALKFQVSEYLLKPIDRIELAGTMGRIRDEIDRARNARTNNTARAESVNSKEERQIIKKVKQIINERLHQEISLQSIAEEVHMNHQYLSVLFKNETGSNFSEYVTQSRMNKAKQFLKDTNLKIYEIANLCGYASSKHFMGVFKQTFGVTATDYRESSGYGISCIENYSIFSTISRIQMILLIQLIYYNFNNIFKKFKWVHFSGCT